MHLHHNPVGLLQPGKSSELAVLFPKPHPAVGVKHRILVRPPHRIPRMPISTRRPVRGKRRQKPHDQSKVRLATIRPRNHSVSPLMPRAEPVFVLGPPSTTRGFPLSRE